MAEGLADTLRCETSWRLLALPTSGVTLSRAVSEPDLADEVAHVAPKAVDLVSPTPFRSCPAIAG